MRSLRTGFVVLLGLWCAGCQPEFYRADTRLLPDGSVERTVYQPLSRVPADVVKSPAWTETHDVREANSETVRQLPIRDMVPRLGKPAKPPGYWIATGKFADAKAIPNHLTFEAPKGLPEGRLVRQLERQEFGVVTEWTWNETLTDCITLADHRAARNEVVDLTATIVVAACAETWGPDYGLKDLEKWLRGDVATCFQELCDAYLELGLNKHLVVSEANLIPFAEILKKHGLDLFDADHKLIKDQAETERRLDEFLARKLRQYVRDKQGRPLSDELVVETSRAVRLAAPAVSTRFSSSLERAAHARYGGKEQFEEQVNRLGIRIFGLYTWPFLRAPQSFDYRLEVAGHVLETNATLVAERTLRWKFDASHAFPLGYLMRAVMAVPNSTSLAKHFPKSKLNTREAVIEYLGFLRADAELRNVLNALVQRNDSASWNAWRAAHADSKRLFELLGNE